MGLQEEKMYEALAYAKKAYLEEEVPVGAVITDSDNRIIGWGHNTREQTQNALKHAEINAIQMAAKNLNSWRLEGTTLYVTLEPCAMCSGAIIQARIPRIVFGAYDAKAGCAGSVINLFQVEKFNHHPEVIGGVLKTESSELLQSFFKKLR